MMLKLVIIGLILVTESLQSGFPKNTDETEEFHYEKPVQNYEGKDHHVKHYKDYSDKRNGKYYESNKGHKKQKYFKEVDSPQHLNEKDHYDEKYQKHWEGKKYHKSNNKEYRPDADFLNINEIDSNDRQGKYNNYEKHSTHPNHFDGHEKNGDVNYHDKSSLHAEKSYDYSKKHKDSYHGQKKPGDLSHDTNVNYVNNHKQIAIDSEFIDVEHIPSHGHNKEQFQKNYQNRDEVFEKRVKKDFYKELREIDLSVPPSPNNTVLMARYIIHNVDWAAMATISSRSPLKSAPFANIISMSDGPVNKGIGVPFFYMTPQDLSSQDLTKDNRVSITVTLAQTNYCQSKGLDPEDPRCARLILSGKIKRIKAGTTEEEFAKNALFSRHPVMETWPADHEFFFAKLKIGQIVLLDRFGGSMTLDVQEYLNAENVK